MSLRGKVAIVGYGEADFERKPGRTSFHFCAQAAQRAMADAQIDASEIDGVVAGYSLVEPYPFFSAALCEYMGMQPSHHATIQTGGSVYSQLIVHAASLILSGVCKTILVVHGDNRASGIDKGSMIANSASLGGHPDYENPFGPMIPSMYALAAQRHMHEYGTTELDLASIAVTHRDNALRNPKAIRKKPLTIEDALNSPMISTPLRATDCCLVSDFGGAVILTNAERAKDAAKPPVYVLGVGEGFTHEYISQSPDMTRTGAIQSGRSAFEMAGLRPDQMKFAQIYDCFTITVLLMLENLGFCALGEGGHFVREGNIALDGSLPVNTYGGMLSCANGGILHIVEAVRQLRGEASGRQLADADVGLVHSQGGILSTHATVILGTSNA